MDAKAGVHDEGDSSRREFLKGMAVTVGGFALAGGTGRTLRSAIEAAHGTAAATLPAGARSAAGTNWTDRIGLELFTVRDLTAKDYLGTLEKIARIGYKEIEPAGGYANLSPKRFRAELDRLGLRMPSTHSGISAGPVADVEKQLADFQVMGIEYTSFEPAPRPAGAPRREGPRRAAPTAPLTPGEQRKRMQQFISRMAQPRTADDVKKEAARYNEFGRIAKRFGIRLLIHNHTVEFIPCKDSDQLPYTILLAETDPELVVFQLDIGWARVAGQDPIQLFKQYPGRFPLWHVKDMDCLEALPPVSDEGARMAAARIVPVGNGEIDYAEIFRHAEASGLKHFCIEQDSAADWGDAIAAARVSYDQLRGMLAGQA